MRRYFWAATAIVFCFWLGCFGPQQKASATACNTTTVGSYGCKQKSQCTGVISGTSTTCAFVTFNSSSNFVWGYTWTNGSGASNTLSGCASVSWTQVLPASGTTNGLQWWQGTISSTSSCTLTVTSSVGSSTINGSFVEISGSSGVIDVKGTPAGQASYTSGATYNCPSITTTLGGDLVFCMFTDNQGNAGTVTAGSGFSVLAQNGYGGGIEAESQSVAGAITPQLTYNSNGFSVAVTFAVEPVAVVTGTAAVPNTALLPNTTVIP